MRQMEGKTRRDMGVVTGAVLHGSPSSQMHGALVLTACPAGQKLIGGLDKIQQQQCVACKEDDKAWPRWSIALEPSHSDSGFGIEWRSSAGRICPNEYWSAYDDSYTLMKLERNTTRNETTLTRFNAGGNEVSWTQKLNLTTKGTFVVRLAETVSESGEVKIGLLFSGHNPGGSNDFFDIGCTWTEPPTWEQWRDVLNLFEKKLVIHGSGFTSAEPVADEFRIGKGYYLTEITLVSKQAEDIAGSGQCLPCPAGGICIKGLFIFSTGRNQLVAREWGSSGGWVQEEKDGRVQLVTCPENYTKFPFATTGIVDELMQLSMQACVKTCEHGHYFVKKTGECTMCDVGYYLAATPANVGKPCLSGLYDTDNGIGVRQMPRCWVLSASRQIFGRVCSAERWGNMATRRVRSVSSHRLWRAKRDNFPRST